MIYNCGYIMEITKTLVLILVAVTKATNALRCYTGMTQNRMPVPGQNAKIEDCSSLSCVTMKYSTNVTGNYLPVIQAICLPDDGVTCNSLCATMEKNVGGVEDCTAKCCGTDMCNDEITKNTVTPIECYTGMMHNGNPVPDMPVNKTNCPSGECANIQYSLSVSGINMKVGQAMCAYPGLPCTKLCDQVTTYTQNVSDCKANCCKTKLCNDEIVNGNNTTVTPIQCYTGMTHNGNPVPDMPINQTSCSSGQCADIQYSLTISGINIKAIQAMCTYPGLPCTKLCGAATALIGNATDCKANCCKTVLCNNAIVGGSKTTKIPEISAVSSTVTISATSTLETTSSPPQNTKETTTPKSGANTLQVFQLTIFIVFLKSFIDFMF